MTTQTIPAFTGKIQSGQGETKFQSRIRCDKRASRIYGKRPSIDRFMEDKALRSATREVWDD